MTMWLVWWRDFGLEKSSRARVGIFSNEDGGGMSAGRGAIFLGGLMLGGCMQSTLEPVAESNFKPRDKQLLAAAPYAKVNIPEPYQRHLVSYHRKEGPGTLVIDTDARYLYYVLPEGKAIRYGVTVG